MKYRYNSPTGYVRPFKKLYRFRPLRGRLWGVFNTPLQLATCDSSKYRCDLSIGGVGVFGRWGLPLAGEVGVNEFGEEEDDDQDYNNEGARGDLQDK